ncbi:response regulator transcription factor [Duganella radicis]|uniref:Response regulator n=1 Tax=Duganella radicis TaxID=551988 RepID=A0A6L6PSB9_9BURK|nr:response regulator transcription factor [Duganella radicis]MTV41734.1 response regulator [Duganella radicis]
MNIASLIRNPSVLETVRATCKQAGFQCVVYPTEALLFRALRRQSFDLILIDFPLAPSDDDSILSWLNCRTGDHTPVLGLSAVHDAHVTALVLNCGADDLLLRPFEPVELVARAHALTRRSNRRTVRRMIDLAGFALDRDASKFAYRGTPIELTPREFSMAWMFFSAPGVYISRETIGSSLWSADSEVAGRTIEQHVYKLRKKLQLGAERGVIIRTAYSQGYRLELIGQAALADGMEDAGAAD